MSLFNTVAMRYSPEIAKVLVPTRSSAFTADTMIKDAMARSDNLRDGDEPTLYRDSQLNAQLSKDDPRSVMYVSNSPKAPPSLMKSQRGT